MYLMPAKKFNFKKLFCFTIAQNNIIGFGIK